MSPLTFQVLGGRFQGAVDAQLGSGVTMALQARLLDVDLAQVAAAAGAGNTVTGRLSGSGSFTGSGDRMATALAAANGVGDASIVNGTFPGLNVGRTVTTFFGRPAPADTNGAFASVTARLTLDGQDQTATALAFQSRDADIVGEATLVRGSLALSGSFDLSLSEALSEQAGADSDGYSREENRIVLPATLGGTLREPRLSIDAAAARQPGFRTCGTGTAARAAWPAGWPTDGLDNKPTPATGRP